MKHRCQPADKHSPSVREIRWGVAIALLTALCYWLWSGLRLVFLQME